jgi:hypothetical protein
MIEVVLSSMLMADTGCILESLTESPMGIKADRYYWAHDLHEQMNNVAYSLQREVV